MVGKAEAYWDKEYGWCSEFLRDQILRYRQEKIDVIPGLRCPECGSAVSQVYSSRITLSPSDGTDPLYLKRLSCSKCDWEHEFDKLRLERSYKFISNYARDMVNSMKGYF